MFVINCDCPFSSRLSAASSITKRLGNKPVLNSHKWSCMIASKRPLATVTLLHDLTRDRFAITGAFFFNSKRATLDLIVRIIITFNY